MHLFKFGSKPAHDEERPPAGDDEKSHAGDDVEAMPIAMETAPAHSLPRGNDLFTFRFLMGITTTEVIEIKGRAARNLGIYPRVVHKEKTAAKQFRLYSFLISGSLGLQMLVAAALTALGASKGPAAIVTVLGAINTVIAGFLTFLKGSGLPNRLKYYRNEWAQVREYIEQRERDFSRDGSNLDVYKVVAAIEKMYKDVKADVEANTPDGYVSVSDSGKRASAINTPPSDSLSRPTPQAVLNRVNEVERKFSTQVGDLEKMYGDERERLSHVGARARETVNDAERRGRGIIEEDVQETGQQARTYADKKLDQLEVSTTERFSS